MLETKKPEFALSRTRFGRLLSGFRGQAPDRDALVETAVMVGNLALAEDGLQSIDINPLFVLQEGVCAVDAKIVLSDKASA